MNKLLILALCLGVVCGGSALVSRISTSSEN